LAERLLAAASKLSDTGGDPLAVLRHAIQLAAEAGRCDLALRAIDMQADRYTVEVWPARLQALTRALRVPQPAKSRESAVEKCLEVVDEAIVAEEYETAEELAKESLAASRKTKAVELTRQIVARASELRTVRKACEAGAEAAEVLTNDPNNAVANATRGKYHVILRHDWAKGHRRREASGRHDQAVRVGGKEVARHSPPLFRNRTGRWRLQWTQPRPAASPGQRNQP